jgi:hypothetical protein
MRVGDAERDATAAQLREHFASGRLTQAELNERLDQTFAARTRGELSKVMTDLPPGQAGGAGGAAFPGTPLREFESRRIGPGAGYGEPDGAGYGWQHGARRTAGAFATSIVVLAALLTIGIIAVFGLGGGWPFGFVLVFAAFALLRRLLFAIFGRRWGGGRGCGGRRGPRRRC